MLNICFLKHLLFLCGHNPQFIFLVLVARVHVCMCMCVHAYNCMVLFFRSPKIVIFDIVAPIGLELTKQTRLVQDLPASASPALGL